MTKHTTLARRGADLASLPSMRDQFKSILNDPYDPDTNPTGFINVGVAENYAMIPEVTRYVNSKLHLTKESFSYGEGPWGTERLRESMAAFINRTFNVQKKIAGDDILFANGVTSICEMLGFTIAEPGDGILFGRPIYQAFQIDFGTKAKVKSVFVDFPPDMDQFSSDAVAMYEKALLKAEQEGTKIRALMLCNPHNPLGRCYSKPSIIALMKLCDKYRIHLLCDEIYANSVYEVPDKYAVPFTSALSFDYSQYIDPDLCHVIYGMSKDFASGGARIGCIYVRNKELKKAMEAINNFHWSGGPNQQVAVTILEDLEWSTKFMQKGRESLAARNKLARQILDDAGIKYTLGANSGFYLWLDLSPFLPKGEEYKDGWERELGLVKQLLANKVFLTNGQTLSSSEPGHFRLIFSQDERTLRAGLERLFKTIGV